MAHVFNSSRPVWQFKTDRFRVSLFVARDRNYRYDGDDEDGETQSKLDSGELVAFDSVVQVELDDKVIAENHLGGSVYAADEVSDFWTAHRDPDPMNRNCTTMRDAHPAGPRVSICHYFPGMVSEAIAEAREYVEQMTIPPRMRGDV